MIFLSNERIDMCKSAFEILLFSFDVQLLSPGAFSLDLAAIEGRVGADRLSEVNLGMGMLNVSVIVHF